MLGEKKKLLINNTFGPLKFNSSKYLVIHLMLYDKGGHIDHAIKSPFTVYDWERSNIYLKKKISEIYKVGSLQLNDFLSARRGLFNYANDIKIKKISFRKYRFFKNKYSTEKHFIRLQSRGDKYEYYFHIVKNLILNYIKFHKKNGKLATVTAVQPPGRYGALECDNDLVKRFIEKPRGDGGWINGGFFVLSHKCLNYID